MKLWPGLIHTAISGCSVERATTPSAPQRILNDLWIYNIASNQVDLGRWLEVANQNGVYPSQTVDGFSRYDKLPPERAVFQSALRRTARLSLDQRSSRFTLGCERLDRRSGNLWLFGGWGLDSKRTDGNGSLNDLWVYTPNATPGQLGTWAWVKGSNTGAQNGIYDTSILIPGTRCTPTLQAAAAALPLGWIRRTSFWLFGGEGNDSTSTTGNGFLNDTWRYVPYQ